MASAILPASTAGVNRNQSLYSVLLFLFLIFLMTCIAHMIPVLAAVRQTSKDLGGRKPHVLHHKGSVGATCRSFSHENLSTALLSNLGEHAQKMVTDRFCNCIIR